jgi:hypothetical protein
MSMPEERCLQINRYVEQIGQMANVDFSASPLGSADIMQLIRDKFPLIEHKADAIARFCIKDVIKYHNRGIVIFIDGGNPGERLLRVDYKELFGHRIAYILCAQIAYSKFVSDDDLGSVFSCVEFDTIVDSIFDFDEAGPMYNRLLSAQILTISNLNKRVLDKSTLSTIHGNFPEKKARISATLDNLISTRIKFNKPTIITVLDDFDQMFSHDSVGTCLKELASMVSDPRNVNDFSDATCSQKCCRLCLAYAGSHKRFGAKGFSENNFMDSLVRHNVIVGDQQSCCATIRDECCKINNVKADDVFYGLRNDLETLARSCPDDPDVIQEFFNSVIRNPKMWCVLKGITNG